MDIVKVVNQNIPTKERYMGEDGLEHCSVCHTPVQTRIKVFGEDKIVGCVCDCIRKEQEAHKEREKQEERERRRRACFAQTNMAGWNFESDDRANAKISDAMQKYAEQFADFRKSGTGLLLYGPVGTGKTYLAACIANRLIDNDYHVKMANFPELINTLQGMFDGKQEYINSLNKYSLLVIDDLGVERDTEYMTETIFNLIDSRYRSGLPFIVTTNLSADEIKNPRKLEYQRIYDRILERCHPIKVEGVSRRRKSVAKNFGKMNELLGL